MSLDETQRLSSLVERLKPGEQIIIRDDQFSLDSFLDLARASRRLKAKFGLLDTGRYSSAEIEILLTEKIRVLTSDVVRPQKLEVESLLDFARKSGSVVSMLMTKNFFLANHNSGWAGQDIIDMIKNGLDVHVSNRSATLDFDLLREAAASARRSRSFFVYYHHGRLTGELSGLASKKAWVHFSDESIKSVDDQDLALATARICVRAGSRAIIYVTKGLPFDFLTALARTGARLNFLSLPSSHLSRQEKLEEKMSSFSVPVRAYYLTLIMLL